MSFLETPRFPDEVQYNTVGGPGFNVDIARVQSGREFRSPNWDIYLHRYNVNNVKTVTGFEEILNYVFALGGPEHGFRFKDWADFKSCGYNDTPAFDDVEIGTGDGAETDFQLIKTYQPAGSALSHDRTINKPVAGSVLVGVGGVQATGANWSLATGTGIITFATGAIPATGSAVTAGYEFDVPVRIDSQNFDPNYTTCNILSFNLPLLEIIP